MQLIYKAG